MDFRKIFDIAFFGIENKYPFSDERSVVDNVLERAEHMKNEDKNDNMYVKELYEIKVPDVPVRKSRAPLIAGIAALTVSAAGIGFFAGGSYMAQNMPDGAPALTPLAGGYSDSEDDVNEAASGGAGEENSETSDALMTSVTEEQEMTVETTVSMVFEDSSSEITSQVYVPELSEEYKDTVYRFDGFRVQVRSCKFDGLTLDVYFDILYDDLSLNTDRARAMHPSAELYVMDMYSTFSNGCRIMDAQPDRVTVFERIEFTKPYNAVTLNFFDFYKASGGRDYITPDTDIDLSENVFDVTWSTPGRFLTYDYQDGQKWALTDEISVMPQKVFVTAHTICFQLEYPDTGNNNYDVLKNWGPKIYLTDGRIIDVSDKLLGSSFVSGDKGHTDIIYHFDDIDLMTEMSEIRINNDVHLMGNASMASVTSAYLENEESPAEVTTVTYPQEETSDTTLPADQ